MCLKVFTETGTITFFWRTFCTSKEEVNERILAIRWQGNLNFRKIGEYCHFKHKSESGSLKI